MLMQCARGLHAMLECDWIIQIVCSDHAEHGKRTKILMYYLDLNTQNHVFSN